MDQARSIPRDPLPHHPPLQVRLPERVRTERLVLRPFDAADAPRVFDIHSRLEVIRWLDDPPHEPMQRLDQAEAWIERWREKAAADPAQGARAIEVAATGDVAGAVLIARLERRAGGFVGEYEIGWHLHPDATGQGLATEAARGWAEAGLAAGHATLFVDMFPDNAPSMRVAQRLAARDHGEVDDPWYAGRSRLFSLGAPPGRIAP